MTEAPILIVGAGPAGLSAAIALARHGAAVMLVDRAPGIGGAVYAHSRTGEGHGVFTDSRKRALLAAFDDVRHRIDIRLHSTFAGIDCRGEVLVTGPDGILFRPRAVILATGARELVQPRPGWTLPGVTTAGALQVTLKTTGHVPSGRVAIAGNGALLYALAAQLTRAGTPPLAVIEAARPLSHPLAALRLPWPVLREAMCYMAILKMARVPILTGTRVRDIAADEGALRLTTSHKGRFRTMAVDRLALHDGLARNDYRLSGTPPFPVEHAGDCRNLLGRDAAVKDGENAARRVLTRLAGEQAGAVTAPSLSFRAERRAQAALTKMFSHDLQAGLRALPGDTILCRCENRTLADLLNLPSAARSARMMRLHGRFGMGACQGRFCLDWVARTAGQDVDGDAIRGRRWPAHPLAVDDILNAADGGTDTPLQQPET